ncbi:MAG: FISUMP domain-containing protein, partial [Massilibacteroides sp.]|nr:FISUMP domain-containing protein [Massilibacteroides sp.]MDD4661156.1 FISUMP domain-containing protein [Massilibacteroides sp.]
MKLSNYMRYVCLLLAAGLSVALNAQNSNSNVGIVINGVTWAHNNVGAPGTFVENWWEPGMYYQWNSKVGWSYESDENGCPYYSIPDGVAWNDEWGGGNTSEWETINDPCPVGWRIPTESEFKSLIEAYEVCWTDNQWHKRAGAGIYVCISFAKSLFFPAGGQGGGNINPDPSYRYCQGSIGKYWTKDRGRYVNPFTFSFHEDYHGVSYEWPSQCLNVRCVK